MNRNIYLHRVSRLPKSIKPISGIQGMDIVLRNLNKEIRAIKDRSITGMIKSAIVIRRDMDSVEPLIPVDTGNLRASWFVVTARNTTGSKAAFKGDNASRMMSDHANLIAEMKSVVKAEKQLMLIMGFSANYTLWVHEMMGATFKRPGAGAKFFEAAVKRNKDKVLLIIKDNAQIK